MLYFTEFEIVICRFRETNVLFRYMVDDFFISSGVRAIKRTRLVKSKASFSGIMSYVIYFFGVRAVCIRIFDSARFLILSTVLPWSPLYPAGLS
jgi:hypothetical protein